MWGIPGINKTRIIKSKKKNVTIYLMSTKFSRKSININDKKVARNKMPVAARISIFVLCLQIRGQKPGINLPTGPHLCNFVPCKTEAGHL